MIFKNTILLGAVLLAFHLNAQDTTLEKDLKKEKQEETADGWKKGGVFSVNMSQVSLSNWAAGGENSVSLNGLLSVYANWKKGKVRWDNSLDIGYGTMKQGEGNFIKTDDRIDLVSKFAREINKKVYYAALLNFRTQMLDGYANPGDSLRISAAFAPAYVLGAIGIDWKPNDDLAIFIAPLTSKTTLVLDQDLADAGAFGVDAATYDALGVKTSSGAVVRNEFGGYLRMAYVKKEIIKNVDFTTKLDLFSNYLHNPGNIDVNWENLLAMKVNKFLVVTVNTMLIYDHDIDIAVDNNDDGIADSKGPRTQFKEVLGVGLSLKF